MFKQVRLLRAVRLLPPAVRELCERLYNDATLPSAALLSRANLFVDVAFMKVMCEKHVAMVMKQSVLFGLTDASPQGGKEYQIMEYYAIDGESLIEAGNAAIQLKRFPKRPADVIDKETQSAEMATLMDIIHAARYQHVFPPQCMAQRQTSLPHKGSCAIRMCRLENWDWETTAKFLQLFFSFTADRGTEKGFKYVHYQNLNLFPEWRAPRASSEDPLGIDEMEVDDPVISLRHVLDISGVLLHQLNLFLVNRGAAPACKQFIFTLISY